MKVLLLIVVGFICLESIDAYCFAMNSCTDAKTNKSYKNGESWEYEPCTTCHCYVTRELQRTCRKSKRSKLPNEVVLKDPSELKRCKKVGKKKASKLPENSVVRYYVESAYSSCCSRLVYPSGVHEECEKKLVIEKCMYKVVNKETGEDCEHQPSGMVGK